MSISPNGPVGAYTYTNDDGIDFFILLSSEVATAGGFVPAGGGLNPFGTRNGRQKVRGVYGEYDDGTKIHRTFVPCPDVGALSALWGTGQVTVGNAQYDLTGRRGERVSRVKPGI